MASGAQPVSAGFRRIELITQSAHSMLIEPFIISKVEPVQSWRAPWIQDQNQHKLVPRSNIATIQPGGNCRRESSGSSFKLYANFYSHFFLFCLVYFAPLWGRHWASNSCADAQTHLPTDSHPADALLYTDGLIMTFIIERAQLPLSLIS